MSSRRGRRLEADAAYSRSSWCFGPVAIELHHGPCAATSAKEFHIVATAPGTDVGEANAPRPAAW